MISRWLYHWSNSTAFFPYLISFEQYIFWDYLFLPRLIAIDAARRLQHLHPRWAIHQQGLYRLLETILNLQLWSRYSIALFFCFNELQCRIIQGFTFLSCTISCRNRATRLIEESSLLVQSSWGSEVRKASILGLFLQSDIWAMLMRKEKGSRLEVSLAKLKRYWEAIDSEVISHSFQRLILYPPRNFLTHLEMG